jgi:tetratricopeptide (TPR) repeat protein
MYSQTRQYERALEYFVQSRTLDPSSQTAAFNIVGSNIDLGRLTQAHAANERFAVTVPGHPMYHVHRFFIAVAEFDYATAEEALDTWAAYGDLAGAVLATRGQMALAGIRGRLSLAERALEASRARAASGRQVREFLIDAISMGRYEIGALGSAEQPIARVEAALVSFPLDRLEPFDRPYAELAEFYAWAGRVDMAREMLAQFEREVPEAYRALTETDYQRALGFLALAEGRTDEALDRFLRSDRGFCSVCVLPLLAQLYDQVGNSDSLFAVLDRFVNTPDDDRIYVDPFELPGAYVRLGELYEARGDEANAIDYYDRFVNLWQDADAELQPQVDDVRQRLARMAAEGGTNR